ncbi:helix-turn-helix domain-containing protein [Tenacibaculum amylolyticum]|uniref:helix-turn-helix domain-containing protein n=1 Tax=Tenacibaculum amylolyticum TaxID=104269 RepID=UPI003893E089
MTKSEVLALHLQAMAIFDANNTTCSIKECAAFLKVHTNTIRNRIHNGTIKAIFLDGTYHIPKLQFLDKIIEDFQEQAA